MHHASARDEHALVFVHLADDRAALNVDAVAAIVTAIAAAAVANVLGIDVARGSAARPCPALRDHDTTRDRAALQVALVRAAADTRSGAGPALLGALRAVSAVSGNETAANAYGFRVVSAIQGAFARALPA